MLLTITFTIVLFHYFPWSYRSAFGRLRVVKIAGSIPRVVHLVQLKPDENSELRFSFQAFLCIYTANYYIKPTAILIHTDYSQDSVEHAIANGTSWTRKVLTAFPGIVTVNEVVPPTSAANGLPLERIEHKSDFVRMEQIAKYGGIYLDWDVLTMRSPTPLLNAGFAAVVGRQVDGNINNGCFMATKNSSLVSLMNSEMPVVFSGEWQHHSVGLITPIAERIASVPGQVLILDHHAFAPTSWWDDSASSLFSEREDDDGPASMVDQGEDTDPMNATERWQSRLQRQDWEIDFSQTYFLHAFKAIWGPVPRFDGVSLQYILRKRSNYALAVWPVVMQGIKDGLIIESDETL
ncbi:unnamed protein product [Discula destructiva]